jgi:hypothetical protein
MAAAKGTAISSSSGKGSGLNRAANMAPTTGIPPTPETFSAGFPRRFSGCGAVPVVAAADSNSSGVKAQPDSPPTSNRAKKIDAARGRLDWSSAHRRMF